MALYSEWVLSIQDLARHTDHSALSTRHRTLTGVGVDSELAAKLARRNQGGNTGLVDNVQKGMANGIPVRQLSFTRKKAPPKASNWQPQQTPRISAVSADL